MKLSLPPKLMKRRQDETQFTTKIDEKKDRMKLSLPPKLMKRKRG